MQTFLPYPYFDHSASCLDMRRLGKQRVEAFQIFLAITNPAYGWQNHPAVNMWLEHECALSEYYNSIVVEWIRRGYRNGMPLRLCTHSHLHLLVPKPLWLGNPRFHRAHKSALLFKSPDHYGQFGWRVKPVLNYWWPVKNN